MAPPSTEQANGAVGPAYASSISAIDATIAAAMSSSWRNGCPVGLDQLRYLRIAHWNFAGTVSTGELIVNASHADGMVEVFRQLFVAGFPIERMELVDVYDADDNASMAANNTSGFNCREVAGSPGVWSKHAFGAAIDINPLINPYVMGSSITPPGGAAFADRSQKARGGIYAGDAVVQAFASVSWGWGGDWTSGKDWQHFSASSG